MPAPAQPSWLKPEPRATALALLRHMDRQDVGLARALVDAIPAEDIPDVLLGLAFAAAMFFPGWVQAKGLADRDPYRGLGADELRQRILDELIMGAASGADGIGGGQSGV